MKKISYDEFDATESTIDTEYFGVASAKVLLKQACVSQQRQSELVTFLQNFEFVVITNKANNSFNNHWLGERTKAFLTDINVQFSKKVLLTGAYDNLSVISDNVPEDSQIIRIAENAFKVSRFLNDPYLSVEKARYIYADITKNAFGRAGRFFALFREAELIAGFLLFSIDQTISSSTIELIAIDQNFAGKGIGRSLIAAMENHVAKATIRTIKVGTQLDNLDAVKFYTSCGFSCLECNSIYHYWPSKP